MQREFGSKGYKVISDTTPTSLKFYGFTVLTDMVISSLTAPTTINEQRTAYDGDEAGAAGPTFLAGVFYPIRGDAVTLASGSAIFWIE